MPGAIKFRFKIEKRSGNFADSAGTKRPPPPPRRAGFGNSRVGVRVKAEYCENVFFNVLVANK